MRLKEWLDANGNKVSTTSGTSSTGTSSGSFKKRLNKLITYYGQHLPAGIDYLTLNLLTNDKLEFTEHYDTGSKSVVKIYIGSTTEAWRFTVTVDRKITDDLSGMGWTELLKTLRAYITVPVTGTPEYKGLLTEWVDSKGKKVSMSSSSQASTSQSASTSSNGYKKRFEKLLNYHIAHKDKDVDKIIYNEIKNYNFHYTEHHTGGVGGYTKDVSASIGKDGSWDFYVFIDGKAVAQKKGKGWDTFVWEISFYLALPDVTTDPEYQDLLESIEPSIAEDFKLYENLWD